MAPEAGRRSLGHLPSKVALGGGLLATAGESWKDWETRPVMRALDVDTGEVRWKHELTDPRVESASVISASPFVASLRTRGAGGRRSLLFLGDGDTEAVTLQLPEGYEKFGERVAVTGGVLVVGLVPKDRTEHDPGSPLGAYSLTTGELIWRWQGGDTHHDTPLAHRGWLLIVHGYGGLPACSTPRTAGWWPGADSGAPPSTRSPPPPGTSSRWAARRATTATGCGCSAGDDHAPPAGSAGDDPARRPEKCPRGPVPRHSDPMAGTVHHRRLDAQGYIEREGSWAGSRPPSGRSSPPRVTGCSTSTGDASTARTSTGRSRAAPRAWGAAIWTSSW